MFFVCHSLISFLFPYTYCVFYLCLIMYWGTVGSAQILTRGYYTLYSTRSTLWLHSTHGYYMVPTGTVKTSRLHRYSTGAQAHTVQGKLTKDRSQWVGRIIVREGEKRTSLPFSISFSQISAFLLVVNLFYLFTSN